MSRYVSVFWAIGALLVCGNWATQSTGGDEKPAINYSAEIVTEGITSSARNVTISGLTKDIPLYVVPTDQSENPTTNTTFISLDLVNSIEPISNIPQQNVRRFNNRDFVEIKVTFKNSVAGQPVPHFLVDRPRRIICEISVGDSYLKKEILFEALGTLTMIGTPQARTTECKNCSTEKDTQKSTEKSAAQEALCKQAKNDLAALDAEAKKMEEKGNKGALSKIIESIKNKINYICG